MRLFDYSGNLIRVQPLPFPMFGACQYAGHRALIHEVLVRHAVSLGIDIRMGQEVVDYWEDGENNTAGVVLRSGESLEADLVVAADGIKSRARRYVLVSSVRHVNSRVDRLTTDRGTMIVPVHPDMRFIEHGLMPRNKGCTPILSQTSFAKAKMSCMDGPVI